MVRLAGRETLHVHERDGRRPVTRSATGLTRGPRCLLSRRRPEGRNVEDTFSSDAAGRICQLSAPTTGSLPDPGIQRA